MRPAALKQVRITPSCPPTFSSAKIVAGALRAYELSFLKSVALSLDAGPESALAHRIHLSHPRQDRATDLQSQVGVSSTVLSGNYETSIKRWGKLAPTFISSIRLLPSE